MTPENQTAQAVVTEQDHAFFDEIFSIVADGNKFRLESRVNRGQLAKLLANYRAQAVEESKRCPCSLDATPHLCSARTCEKCKIADAVEAATREWREACQDLAKEIKEPGDIDGWLVNVNDVADAMPKDISAQGCAQSPMEMIGTLADSRDEIARERDELKRQVDALRQKLENVA